MEASKRIRYDVLALQETKVKAENTRKTDEGDLIILGAKVDKKNIGGVGFIVHRNLEPLVDSFNIISPRLAVLKIKVNNNITLAVFNAYAPTSAAAEEEKEDFYTELEDAIKREKAFYKYICGDFNATIQKHHRSTSARIGPHGSGVNNDNGDRITDLLETCNLYHGNSWFQKRQKSRWTWESPNGQTHSELDHILTNRRWSLLDVGVVEAFRTGSDHRLVRAKIRLNQKMKKKNNHRPPHIQFPEFDADRLETSAAEYNWQDLQDLTEDYKHLCTGILHCAAVATSKQPSGKQRRLDDNTRELLKKRSKIHNDPKSTALDKATINKICRFAVAESIKKHRDNKIKTTAENRASLKRCRKSLIDSRPVLTAMKDVHGKQQSSRNKIEKNVGSFYSKLYESSTAVARTPTPTQDELPLILSTEVEHAIKQMKPKTASGPDNISGDLLKTRSHTIIQKLTERFNRYLKEEQIPDQWKTSKTVLLFKKGERDDIKNYRPIALLSQPYKLFTKVIMNRLEKTLDEFQPVEQAGFRKGFSCMDHIHTVTQIIEKTKEYKIPLLMCFIDYTKAFDSVELNAVWNSLAKAGVENKYINMLEECNQGTSTKIRLFHKDITIPIGKGVRQGDTISPKLFTTALQYVMLNLEWSNKGLPIDGKNISNLRFADDIVLISKSPTELQIMVDELDDVGRSIGLTMNRSKTEVMRNQWADQTPITLQGTALPEVDRYVYLGRMVSMDNDLKPEIGRRRGAAWATMKNIKEAALLINDKKIRAQLFDSTVLPALCYGAETWADNKTINTHINTTQRALERSLLGTNRREQYERQLKSADLRKQSGIRDAVTYIRKAKHRWAGHLVRRTDDRWTSRTTFWYPRDVKRTIGRPATRWSDTFKCLNTPDRHWLQIATDRRNWKETCARRLQAD